MISAPLNLDSASFAAFLAALSASAAALASALSAAFAVAALWLTSRSAAFCSARAFCSAAFSAAAASLSAAFSAAKAAFSTAAASRAACRSAARAAFSSSVRGVPPVGMLMPPPVLEDGFGVTFFFVPVIKFSSWASSATPDALASLIAEYEDGRDMSIVCTVAESSIEEDCKAWELKQQRCPVSYEALNCSISPKRTRTGAPYHSTLDLHSA
mmetsp:Transcript_13077/g.38446  ORF Transcript_13077/g.38446 Transcript_13077/m.38446 type:complete len:213 (-) Transcript_13077:371-1009(-)